jgi:integrase
MPRPAKPYLERDWYVSRAGGVYIKLCHRSDGMAKARAILKEHLKERDRERERNGGRNSPNMTVAEVFALFLEAVETERSPSTYDDYQRWCVMFANQHGKQQARDIRRFDAQQFKQQLLKAVWKRDDGAERPYRPKTINHALIALRRAFNWAIDNELLPEGRNPFTRIKLLPCQGRQRVATEEEYQALLRHCTDDHFRDVLVAMRYTSARPGDIRGLTWAMVKWDRRAWVIHDHKTSKTARDPKPRVIGMSEAVEQMLRDRLEKYGEKERVFFNQDGAPWKKSALCLRMRRLRKRAGVKPDERGEEFVLYTNRHSFLTQAAMHPEVTEAMLMDVAGHTDSRTTRKYIHLAEQQVADAGRKVADAMSGQQDTPGK